MTSASVSARQRGQSERGAAGAVSVSLCIAQDPAADELLGRDGFALLVGMLLDQQFPIERAFAGAYRLAVRLGDPNRLDPVRIAAMDPGEFVAVMSAVPAIHRFPGAMAGRVQALARYICQEYDGDAAALWSAPRSGAELLSRLRALPGFGDQKSRIFLALLGKQLAIRPRGWRTSAEPYGEKGSRRSVADVTSKGTLAEVRAFKQAAKQSGSART